VLGVKDDTPVKRAAQHAADDVIRAIMKADGFLKGVFEFNQTKDLHVYCVADSLQMCPDDVRGLPPIAPSSDHDEAPAQDLGHKLPASIGSALLSTKTDGAKGRTASSRTITHQERGLETKTLAMSPATSFRLSSLAGGGTQGTLPHDGHSVKLGATSKKAGNEGKSASDLRLSTLEEIVREQQKTIQKHQETIQKHQETIQKHQVEKETDRMDKEALQKKVDDISKKLSKMEIGKDSGNLVDLGPLVAIKADDLENAPAARKENQARQERFNEDMEDRVSRLYTHVAGLDEKVAAQERQHDRTENLVYRLASKRHIVRQPIELSPREEFLVPPNRSIPIQAGQLGGMSQFEASGQRRVGMDALSQRERERQGRRDAQHEKD